MEQRIKTVGDPIDLWGSTEVGRKRGAAVALAVELNALPTTVRAMRHRNSISKKYWPDLLRAARQHVENPKASPKFADVTAQLLVDLSAASESPRPDSLKSSVPALAS